jgi:hypothetical protein
MGSRDDSLQLSTTERVQAMMTAKTSAEALKADGKSAAERGARTPVPMEQAQAVLEGWPDAPQKTGQVLLEHYGAPHEMTDTKFFWYRIGPWARMELTADEVVHNFPTPHTDYLAQYVDYPVPAERAHLALAFDGSLEISRTAGQMGSRCDSEAANTLTLNVLVDLLEGRRTVEESRAFLAENLAAYALGRDAPYAERLQFTPDTGTADPDEGIIGQAVLDQLVEKAKDTIGQGDPPQA